MEEKVGFFKTVAGMFKGLVRPSEYIKTGRKSSWFAIHVAGYLCQYFAADGCFLYSCE